jgi:hypothetical protein
MSQIRRSSSTREIPCPLLAPRSLNLTADACFAMNLDTERFRSIHGNFEHMRRRHPAEALTLYL